MIMEAEAVVASSISHPRDARETAFHSRHEAAARHRRKAARWRLDSFRNPLIKRQSESCSYRVVGQRIGEILTNGATRRRRRVDAGSPPVSRARNEIRSDVLWQLDVPA